MPLSKLSVFVSYSAYILVSYFVFFYFVFGPVKNFTTFVCFNYNILFGYQCFENNPVRFCYKFNLLYF